MDQHFDITLVRHGETHANLSGIMQGRSDSELTKDAVSLLRYAKTAYFDSHDYDLVYCSPLGRARHTARIILSDPDQVFINNKLVEISHGLYDGEILKPEDDEFLRFRSQHRWDMPWPRGESYGDADYRINAFCSKHIVPNKKILIVAHETVNKLIIGTVMGYTPSETMDIKQPNHIIYRIHDGVLEHISMDILWTKGYIR